MTPAELIAASRTVITKMTGNANFATPKPTLAALGGLADDAEAAINDVAVAKAVLDEKMLARDTAQADLAPAYEQEGAYVQSESGGDEAKILSSGFGVRGTAAPASPVGQVQNVSLTEGDNPGSLDEQHDPVANRSSYEVGLTTVDPVNGPYTQVATPTASKCVLTGLTSGQRVWVRVRAIGAAGPGPWSDPATKIVP
jgi:hypothetical protein